MTKLFNNFWDRPLRLALPLIIAVWLGCLVWVLWDIHTGNTAAIKEHVPVSEIIGDINE